jgi:hypothetical protein
LFPGRRVVRSEDVLDEHVRAIGADPGRQREPEQLAADDEERRDQRKGSDNNHRDEVEAGRLVAQRLVDAVSDHAADQRAEQRDSRETECDHDQPESQRTHHRLASFGTLGDPHGGRRRCEGTTVDIVRPPFRRSLFASPLFQLSAERRIGGMCIPVFGKPLKAPGYARLSAASRNVAQGTSSLRRRA